MLLPCSMATRNRCLFSQSIGLFSRERSCVPPMPELSHVHCSAVRPNRKLGWLEQSCTLHYRRHGSLLHGVTRFSVEVVVNSDHDAYLDNFSWLPIPLRTKWHLLYTTLWALQDNLCPPSPLASTHKLYVLADSFPSLPCFLTYLVLPIFFLHGHFSF